MRTSVNAAVSVPAVGLLAVGGISWSLCNKNIQTTSFRIAQVTRGELLVTISATGTIVEKRRLRSGLGPRLSLAQGLRTLFKTSRHPRTAEELLDNGQFKSTISCLQGDCPLEDGQMGNPGL